MCSPIMYTCVIVSVCLLAVVGVEAGYRTQRQTGTVAEQLRLLIQEESTIRAKLDTRLAGLRAEAGRINNTIVPCNCPVQFVRKPKGPSVAYSGTLPSYTSSLTTSTVLKYTGDLINVGSPFNVSSGHFRANVSGLYVFSMAVFMQPAYWTDMELVRNGSPVLYARTGHYKSSSTNRQVNMATNFALVNLTAGDEVWPRYKSSSSSNLYADGVTGFSGVLLREM